MSQTKHCKRCDRKLPLSKFTKHKNSKDGLNFYCKDCISEKGRKYRQTTKSVYGALKGRMNFYKTKPVLISFENFKEWWENIPRVCAYCGISEEDVVKLEDSYNSLNERLTIDCINNYEGYVEGNMVLACRRCNNMKSDLLNFEQMRYIGQHFLKPIWEKQLGKKIV